MASASKEPTSKRSGTKKTASRAKAAVKAPAKKAARKKVAEDDDDLPVDGELEDEDPDGEDGVEEAPARGAGRAKGARKGKSLVIVESPAKAKTINKYLGKDYVVKASMGHIRDLPKGKLRDRHRARLRAPTTPRSAARPRCSASSSKLAKVAPVDLPRARPRPRGRGDRLAPGRVARRPRPGQVFRVVFNEITKKAILEAFEHPGKLDMDKVDAQQARRVLDRIMGYKLSPLLWKKIAKGLSAGRVQSVAVRLIVEREKEIRAFVKEEYWQRHGATSRSEGRDVPRRAAAPRRAAHRQEPRREARRGRGRAHRRAIRCVLAERRGEAQDAAADAALHDLQLQQKASTHAALLGQEDDDDRAAALRGRRAARRGRGRPDHLHAHGLDARLGRGASGRCAS